MHEAKIDKSQEVVVWGTGTPRREFLHSDDMADACVFLADLAENKYSGICRSIDRPPLFNVGCGEDLSIRDLTATVKDVVNFDGTIVWDQSKPDGTPRKLLDISHLQALGWTPKIGLRDGIRHAYQDFLAHPRHE
jgi:GDP-L-fucose synthase